MTLVRRHLALSAALALPAALLIVLVVNWLKSREQVVLLERVAVAHVSDIMREACVEDPQWFLAGPRIGRPSLEDRQMPDADVRLPRPRADRMPFEIFAYDDQFSPTSVAGPTRFPDTFKRALRSNPSLRTISGKYDSEEGTGLQSAIVTGWTPGPCAILLFRQQPAPLLALKRAGLFTGLFALCFAIASAATAPTAARVRRLSIQARSSAANDYSEIVTVSGHDEVGSLSALFNDTAADLRRKATDARDREEALHRYVENTTTDVGEPLVELERRLTGVLAASADRASQNEMVSAVKEAHRLGMQLQNQAAAIRLRAITDSSPREAVSLAAVIARLVRDRAPLAEVCGVTIDATKATEPATVQADPALIEQAIANVLDNAIIYNTRGGAVRVELHAYDHGKRFRLLVVDAGPGVSDDEFAGLTANKRFRGDESRSRRPGGRGLGLALAREVADRFGMQFDLRQPTTGGLEVEFATRT